MKKTVHEKQILFTNEAMNDQINFKIIIPNLLLAYHKENLQEYYKMARMFLNHNVHLIGGDKENEQLRNKLNTVQQTLFIDKPRIQQKMKQYNEKRANAFITIEEVVLTIYQKLHEIGYFKKSYVVNQGESPFDQFVREQNAR